MAPREDKRERDTIGNFVSVLGSGSLSGYVSGRVLARDCGISQSAVRKKIFQLLRYGYVVESSPGRGYRLTSRTHHEVQWELASDLHTSFVGNRIVYNDIIGSTQDAALAFVARNKQGLHGTVFIAAEQKHARGRVGRTWISPKGGLWMSVIFKPRIRSHELSLLPLVAAIAAYDAIKVCTGLAAELKWPNDIMISGKKVAGIVLDAGTQADRVNYAVVGIGINANFDPLDVVSKLSADNKRQKVTSIRSEIGHDINVLQLTRVVLEKIEQYYLELERSRYSVIVKKWKKCTNMLGRKVAVIQNGKTIYRGTALDIRNDGALIIRTGTGRNITITSGDIRVRF